MRKQYAETVEGGMLFLDGELHRRSAGLFQASSELIKRLPQNDSVKLAVDVVLIIIAALWTWFVSFSQVKLAGSPLPFLGVVVSARLIVYMALRLHRLSWFGVSRYEVSWLAISALVGVPLILLFFFVLPQPFTLRAMARPYLVMLTEPALYLLLLCGARLAVRFIGMESRSNGHHRILIVGARDAGRSLAYQLQESNTEYTVVGFVDDDPSFRHRRIRGLPVLGALVDIPDLIQREIVHEVVIAIPSLPPEQLRLILTSASPHRVPVRIVPPLHEMIGGKSSPQALREVRMEDLLPRPEVDLDRAVLSGYLQGRTVLVTGGGGSIGGELCRQVLSAGASELIVLGRGENSVFEMVQELEEINSEQKHACRVIPAICDVRERSMLTRVFEHYQPQVVFHAAAHKHVPLMESHPAEAVKNNVAGTLNVVQLAVQHQVERFVMVSTDKAVDPSSIMGATKRIGELIVCAYAAHHKLSMVCVRFGNVLGSRGSVVPTMTRQIRRGLPVTVTDPEMVRYFMTIPEAVQLVLQAGAKGGTGDIYMLEMGRPVRILDLAYDLIRLCGLVPEQDIPIRIIGRRPGEKIEEVLLTEAEGKAAAHQGDFHVAPTSNVRLPELLVKIERLVAAANDLDDAHVREALREVVPNFCGENGRSAQTREAAYNGHSPSSDATIAANADGLNQPLLRSYRLLPRTDEQAHHEEERFVGREAA